MGLFDRIGRGIVKIQPNMVESSEDEKMLEQALLEMQEDLVQLRQALLTIAETR